MSVLIVLDMVTDVAYLNLVSANNPLVAEVFASAVSVHEVAAHFALQQAHYLLSAFILTRAVQPRYHLVLAIKLTFPLLERSVTDSLMPPLFMVNNY